MRYNAIARMGTLIVGGILTATITAACLSPSLEAPLSQGETMSLGQWRAERASQVQEDEAQWDCRVQGNATCGDTWYELVCPDAQQTDDLVCTLEAHKIH